ARTAQARGCVEPLVILGDDGGKRHPTVGWALVIGIVEEEGVPPGNFRSACLLACDDERDSRLGGHERDDVVLRHVATSALTGSSARNLIRADLNHAASSSQGEWAAPG